MIEWYDLNFITTGQRPARKLEIKIDNLNVLNELDRLLDQIKATFAKRSWWLELLKQIPLASRECPARTSGHCPGSGRSQ